MSKHIVSATAKTLSAAALGVALALAGGCASTSDLAAIRAIAEQAQADASAALQAANEANARADEASRMSQDTDERVNRMFRRTLQK